jgi:O-antigen biosynthesis protein
VNRAIVPGRVSVITPCFNAGAFVAETIRSVASQRYGDIEHIVVDDASTDDSWMEIQSFGDRVRAIRQPRNAGGAASRNRGAALATGEFLMFLDADDVLGAGTLQALVRLLSEQPDCIGVCRWHRLVKRGQRWSVERAERPLPDLHADQLLGWLRGRWVPPCAVLWPRAVFGNAGGWDETLTLNDDGDLMMRVLARGVRLVITDEGDALYRMHGDDRLSVSRNVFGERHLRSQLRVFIKLIDELQALGRLDPYRTAIGTSLQSLALTSHQLGAVALARECSVRGAALAGQRAVSRTWVGRMLTALLGMERKERLVGRLGALGLMTRERRRFVNRIRLHVDGN